MPDRIVRGIAINYEVIGNTGPFIALTPGGEARLQRADRSRETHRRARLSRAAA